MQPLLELIGVTKRFPGVLALRKVNASFFPGRVHALLGENGAGKSTMVKVISGIYAPDEGTLLIDGKPVRVHSPHESEKFGIAVVHQHRTLVDELSVSENLFLGQLGSAWSPFRQSSWNERARDLLNQVGLHIDPRMLVSTLGPAAQQMVEVARALGRDARVIVFDEPTTSLTPPERQILFELVNTLRDRGLAVIYISHDLEDTLELSDEVTVLRDGQVVTHEMGLKDVHAIVHHMIGRELDAGYPRERVPSADVVLAADGICNGTLNGVDVAVNKGEIVCIAGLVGSGRTELLRALFGLDRVTSGQVRYGGRSYTPHSPRRSINKGIGMVTEDRKRQGLVLELGVSANIVLGNEKRLARLGLLSGAQERRIARKTIQSLRIKTSSPEAPVGQLSGGNQQKVVLGRWLARHTQLLLIDEPTVGIDVGARSEFYKLLDDSAAGGGACIVVSSDLTEVLGLADRVVVMRGGVSVTEVKGHEMTRENLLRAMTVVEAA